MDGLFSHLISNVMGYMMYEDEKRYLMNYANNYVNTKMTSRLILE
jgi:hypothetical protein